MEKQEICRCGTLCVMSMGLAMGIIWAAAILIMGIVACNFGYGRPFVEAVGSLYVGYAPTAVGVILGTIWAFFDAFLGAVIFAWLYNIFVRCCRRVGRCRCCRPE